MNTLIAYPSIAVPRQRTEVLTRRRLLNQLYQLAERKLIIISAPPGYGKTSLLVDYVHQEDVTACWYTVDQQDRHLQRFLAHFIASIAKKFENFGSLSNAVLNGSNQPEEDIESLIIAFANDIYENIEKDFWVIFDNYQTVRENPHINAFISRFVQRVSENCHLILATREQPEIPELQFLIAQGQADVIGVHDLAFTLDELNALAQCRRYRLTDDQLADIISQTEGWITGIILTPLLRRQHPAGLAPSVRSIGPGLAEYWDSLLKRQDKRVRNLLLQTSPLDEFNAGLCRRLLHDIYPTETDWDALLEILLRSNLFVQPADEEAGWLRYHNLFCEYLQTRLEQDFPGFTDLILRRLLEVYRENGDWERAYNLCLRLNDHSLVFAVIEQAGPDMLKQGLFKTLEEWLSPISSNQLIAHPGLLSLKGTVALNSQQVVEGIKLLDQAAVLQGQDDLPGLALTLVRRSTGHHYLGHYNTSLADAEQALKLVENNPKFADIQAHAIKNRGINLLQLSHDKKASRDIKESLEIYRSLGDEANVASVQVELGSAYASIGDLDAAKNYFANAMSYWRKEKDFYRLARLLNNVGVINHESGDFEQSLMSLDEGLKFARLTGFVPMEAFLLTSLGDLYVDVQAYPDARRTYVEALTIAQKINNRYLCFHLKHAQAALARLTGDLKLAGYWIEDAAADAMPNSCREQGCLALENARISMAEHNNWEAIEDLEKALTMYQTNNLEVEIFQVHLYLAVAYLAVGNEEQCYTHCEFALSNHLAMLPHQFIVETARQVVPALEYAARQPRLGIQAARLLEQVHRFNERLPEVRRKLRRQVEGITLIQPNISIRALGEMSVTLQDKTYSSASWQSRTQRDMFYYLLLHPEGASRDQLFQLFWGNSEEQRNQVANTVYKMRQILGDATVVSRQDRYYFNRAIDYEYDVEIFQHHWQQARHEKDVLKKMASYRAMLEQYRGRYAEEAEGSWAIAERERLYQGYLQAVNNLVEYHFGQGEYDQGLKLSLDAMQMDIYQELFYRLAMRASAMMGDNAGIHHHYRQCEKWIKREYGNPPSEETQDLYRRLIG